METIVGSVCDNCKHIMSVRYKVNTVKCAKCGTEWVLGWRQNEEVQRGGVDGNQLQTEGRTITGRSPDGTEEEPKVGGRKGGEDTVERARIDSEPSVS